jgi:hypothetical protein
MSIVKVTFKMEGSDDDDRTGLTEDEYTDLFEVLPNAVGAYDIEVEKVSA